MNFTINDLKKLLLNTEENRSPSVAKETIEELSNDDLTNVGGGWFRAYLRWSRSF
ncbi:hypothetical protein [Mixta theicola]|uniref:hypothetical protein n=1 Tax=Mixta theicola TaxID=1458355 RepID=UPI0013FDF60A|nr:hypothetical protein [Mixta theicola]GLR10733.1 hypothetical protein GCM10007905_34530 [Mixta theicola]